jgi:hypothetical protein
MAKSLQKQQWPAYAVVRSDTEESTIGDVQEVDKRTATFLALRETRRYPIFCVAKDSAYLSTASPLVALDLAHPRLLQRWGQDLLIPPAPAYAFGVTLGMSVLSIAKKGR